MPLSSVDEGISIFSTLHNFSAQFLRSLHFFSQRVAKRRRADTAPLEVCACVRVCFTGAGPRSHGVKHPPRVGGHAVHGVGCACAAGFQHVPVPMGWGSSDVWCRFVCRFCPRFLLLHALGVIHARCAVGGSATTSHPSCPLLPRAEFLSGACRRYVDDAVCGREGYRESYQVRVRAPLDCVGVRLGCADCSHVLAFVTS